jgi:exonuclease III
MANQNAKEGEGAATSIYTFNVRGIRDKNKRNRLFNYLKKNMKGIVYLQETYSVPGDIERWTKEWGGHIFMNSGTSHSRGVAILIPKNMIYEVKTIEQDEDGRYIVVAGTFNSYDMTLINVYAPTGDKVKEQIKFLENISKYMNEYSNNIILGGDLNTYLSELDKYGKIDKISEYASKINNYLQDMDLVDIWRLINPETK